MEHEVVRIRSKELVRSCLWTGPFAKWLCKTIGGLFRINNDILAWFFFLLFLWGRGKMWDTQDHLERITHCIIWQLSMRLNLRHTTHWAVAKRLDKHTHTYSHLGMKVMIRLTTRLSLTDGLRGKSHCWTTLVRSVLLSQHGYIRKLEVGFHIGDPARLNTNYVFNLFELFLDFWQRSKLAWKLF